LIPSNLPIRFLRDPGSGPWHSVFPARPFRTILFGALTFEERWSLLLTGGHDFKPPDNLVLVAPDLSVPTEALCREIAEAEGETVWINKSGRGVAALLGRERLDAAAAGTPLEEIAPGIRTAEGGGAFVVEHPWDLIVSNGTRIMADLELPCESGGRRPQPLEGGRTVTGPVIEGEHAVLADEGARIEPFVFLDTREGPIRIGRRVVIEAHATIRGPVCIRDDALIRGGAKIVEGTTVGEASRVGGEVEATLFGAFSNKQHEGFLGHAVVGEWVNLGASTNNSDLKNNYGTVRLDFGAGPVETGSAKIGCFLADHVKSAIGTRIGTGAVVGTCTNLFGPGGLVTGYHPPFSWGEEDDLYDFDRAVETIGKVRNRRSVPLGLAGRPVETPQEELTALRALWEAARARRGAGS